MLPFANELSEGAFSFGSKRKCLLKRYIDIKTRMKSRNILHYNHE
jgi:hypothetical protein